MFAVSSPVPSVDSCFIREPVNEFILACRLSDPGLILVDDDDDDDTDDVDDHDDDDQRNRTSRIDDVGAADESPI